MPAKRKIQKEKAAAAAGRDRAKALSATLDATNNGDHAASAAEKLRHLYASLLRCRMIQEQLRTLRGGNDGSNKYDLAIGREAVTVGATADLGAGDTVAASPRNAAALVAREMPFTALLSGSPEGTTCCHARAVPDDPFHAGVGIALAHKLEQKHNVAVAFCAEQQPRLERWHDALKFAAGHKLPIVFVIENGISGERADAPAPHLEPVSFMTRDYGFPGILVDGCDVVAVWRVTQEAIHRARIGSGATLIDCRTDPARDPLAHMEHYLRQREAWDDGWRSRVEAEIRSAIDSAFQRTG